MKTTATATTQPLAETLTTSGQRRAWQRLLPILRCPVCRQAVSLDASGDFLGCTEHRYPIRDGVPFLLAAPLLDEVRRWSPGRPSLRQRVWRWVPGPVTSRRQARLLRRFLADLPAGALVFNIGSGSWRLSPEVVNLDLYPFAGVDLAGDIHNLPLADRSIEAIVSMGTLEHIERPEAAVSEFFRVLKPGGKLFCTIPFLQAYHEDPVDLRRWTASGVDRLFGAFAERSIEPSHGPGSAFTWIGAEYFATLLSLGNPRMHTLWLMIWRYLLAPFKWTDAFTEGCDFEHRVSSGFRIVATRP